MDALRHLSGVALGLVGVLVLLWLTLRFAGVVRRLLGQAGIELVTVSRACC